MNQQEQSKKAVAVVRRLTHTLSDASQVSVVALKLRQGAAPEVICTLAVAEALANQVTQLALTGLAAVGLSPNVPNGMSDDEIASAFVSNADCMSREMGLCRASAEVAAEQAGVALLTQAEELAGIARQLMFRAGFYVSRAEVMREAK